MSRSVIVMPSYELTVMINGEAHGTIYQRHKRWCWIRRNGGVDTWPARTKRDDLIPFIARVYRVAPEDVSFRREVIPMS